MSRLLPEVQVQGLNASQIHTFQTEILTYYQEHRRKMPWRETDDPYRILVSEIMLQQTQVDRVLKKYSEFITKYPNFFTLASASLRDVLAAWQGLGYNRRAVSLRTIAQRVITDFGGTLPDSREILQTLPGIGPATAGAVCVFAFQQRLVFIETNIRRVFLHFFFPNRFGVKDSEIRPLVAATLRDDVREWYYALMDYGAALARTTANPNQRSAHHHRQTPFQDSERQIRGKILRALVAEPHLTEARLIAQVGKEETRTRRVIRALMEEGFVQWDGDQLCIPGD